MHKYKNAPNFWRLKKKYNKHGWHIHHVDFGKNNDNEDNLLVCTAKEHWELHFHEFIRTGSARHAYACNFISNTNDLGEPMISGFKRGPMSDETKAKLSESKKEIQTRLGAELSDTTKEAISKSVSKAWSEGKMSNRKSRGKYIDGKGNVYFSLLEGCKALGLKYNTEYWRIKNTPSNAELKPYF